MTAATRAGGVGAGAGPGVIVRPNEVTNGTFDTDTTGWTSISSAILSVVSGQLLIENGAANVSKATQQLLLVNGANYRITGYFDYQAGANQAGGKVQIGSTIGASDILNSDTYVSDGFISTEFTAGATNWISLQCNSADIGKQVAFDNIEVRRRN